MEHFPLLGPEYGAISLHALETSAAISIVPLQDVCPMEIASSQWKLLHSWATKYKYQQ